MPQKVVRAGYLTGVPVKEVAKKEARPAKRAQVAGEAPKTNWLPWVICGAEGIIIIALLARRK